MFEKILNTIILITLTLFSGIILSEIIINDNISYGKIGSLFLICGSYFMLNGNIFKSTIFFAFADIMWVILSITINDILGASMILYSLVVGLIVLNKMHNGKFIKNLKKEEL